MVQLCHTQKDFATGINLITKGAIPFHTNQYDVNHPEGRIRGCLSRLLAHGKLGLSGNTKDLEQIALLARSAEAFGAGVCNDLSASTLLTIMRNEDSIPPESLPVCRIWNSSYGHSFITLGDPRVSTPSTVLDTWNNNMEAQSTGDFWGLDPSTEYDPVIFNPRSPGEFKLDAEAATNSADETLLQNYHQLNKEEMDATNKLAQKQFTKFRGLEGNNPLGKFPYYRGSRRFNVYPHSPNTRTAEPSIFSVLKKPPLPPLFMSIEKKLKKYNTPSPRDPAAVFDCQYPTDDL